MHSFGVSEFKFGFVFEKLKNLMRTRMSHERLGSLNVLEEVQNNTYFQIFVLYTVITFRGVGIGLGHLMEGFQAWKPPCN